MKSWRTTSLGIITILAALLGVVKAFIDGDPSTNPDWTLVAAALTSGLGLIKASDNKVTSEQAGAK